MGNANYIGRVGALAVALGIGTAVATTPWVAVAEPSADSASASDTSASSTSSATESTSTDDSNPAPSVDASGGAPAAADTGLSGGDPRSGIAQSSGGAHTSSGSTVPEAPEVDEDDADTSATPETSEDTAGSTETPALDEPVVDLVPAATTEPDGEASAARAAGPTGGSDHESGLAATAVTKRLLVADPPAADNTAADPDTGAPAAATRPPAVSVTPVTNAAVVNTLAPAAQAAPVSPVGVVARLVSTVSAWLGLGPSMSAAPATPAAQSLLWGLLAWVRREIQRTFFNQTPTTSYNPAENSQTITDNGLVTAVNGDLKALDADGDALTFSVVQAPGDGSVRINPDGTFVYTPGRELAALGGTDVFVVKVADVGFHLHGPLALFKPDFGRSTTTTVDVVVDPTCAGNCQVNPIKVIATIDVGEAPDGVAVSADGTRAYVANALGETVSVIDTATNTVIATIPVGNMPRDVAVNPAGTRAYVTNLLDGTVSVIDTANNAVITTIPVGVYAERLAVSPGGGRVYVAASQDFGSTVSVISTATNTVTAVSDPLNGHPYGLAVHPNGGRVFVTTQIDWLDVIDTVTNDVTHIDTDGGWLWGVALSPLGTRVYIASSDDGTVSVRSTNTNAVMATIDVGENPNGLAISPDGTRVYVLNKDDDTMSVIRTSTNTVIATVDVGNSPNEVAISPDGTLAYVTNSFSDTVSVLQLV